MARKALAAALLLALTGCHAASAHQAPSKPTQTVEQTAPPSQSGTGQPPAPPTVPSGAM